MSLHLFSKNSFPICLAPMVGLSHFVLRKVVSEYMPLESTTIWPTEMLSSLRIPKEDLGKKSETYIHSDEKKSKQLVPQLLGNQKEPLQKSIQKLQIEWNIAGIDINMGCPVQKALKHNFGVALMGDVDYASDVVRMAVDSTDRPVSVKLRSLGSDQQLLHFSNELVKAGAAWITLHPRQAHQQRRGQADWKQIAVLKKEFSIPVIGNGDIQTCEDILSMLQETQADKVMVGRALTARPWLMWQYAVAQGLELPEPLRARKVPLSPDEEAQEYKKMLLRFIQLCQIHYICELKMAENLVLRKIQFFIKTSHVWLEFGHRLYTLSTRAQSLEQLVELVEEFFSFEQKMFPRTELRQ